MKLPAFSQTTRQLIIFGLIVGLLWYGSGPIIGQDGRIVCCSSDYLGINFFSYLQQADTFPPTVDIVQVVSGNASGLELLDLPVTYTHWCDPSKFWQTAIEFIPALQQNRRIKLRVKGGWVFYFSVTPEQFERLNKVRDSEEGVLMFQ